MSAHFLSAAQLTAADIGRLLELARSIKGGQVPKVDRARVANLFFEPSTRTRTSFEIAERALGLEVISLAMQNTSVQKGESLRDTVLALVAMGVTLVVLRHQASGASQHLAERLPAGVSLINAGDGEHEHPTQAQLDAITLQEHFGSLDKKKVTIVGDIRHSRVARSNLHCLPKLGATVKLFGPMSLVPKGLGEVAPSWAAATDDADALMMLRLQQERMTQGFLPDLSDYRRGYGLTAERAAALPEKTVVLHPGPMNRGVEIDAAVADGPRSLIRKQVENGVFVRMAVLAELLGAA